MNKEDISNLKSIIDNLKTENSRLARENERYKQMDELRSVLRRINEKRKEKIKNTASVESVKTNCKSNINNVRLAKRE